MRRKPRLYLLDAPLAPLPSRLLVGSTALLRVKRVDLREARRLARGPG